MEQVETVILFRPVGPEELALLRQNGFSRWPPRLPEQPILYPVTTSVTPLKSRSSGMSSRADAEPLPFLLADYLSIISMMGSSAVVSRIL